MNYQEFLNYVKDHVTDEMVGYEEAEVLVNEVLKNNDTSFSGLCIKLQDEKMAPNLYLNPYYEKYQMGHSLEQIIHQIREQYLEALKNQPIFEVDFTHFENVKDNLILRLVNYKMNKKALKESPYLRYHDLAITFRFMTYQDEIGISTVLLQNSKVETWGKGKEELYEMALQNTKRLFPEQIQSMKEVMEVEGFETVNKKEPLTPFCVIKEEPLTPLYVLSNECGINGATALLYPDTLKEFAEKQDCNLFILPSSIHEVILVPENEYVENTDLYDIVKEANETVVEEMEVLSDNVYYYDRQKDAIKMI